MPSTLRLIFALTLWFLIFPVAVCAQTGVGDSGQLALTLRIANANETTDIVDPLDVAHALALYGKLAHVSCDSSHLDACPAYIITNIVRWTPNSSSGDTHAPNSVWYLVHPESHRKSQIVGLSLSKIQIDGALRIYGSKSVGLLVVHKGVSALAAAIEVRYTIEAKPKKSVQETDALSLINILVGSTKPRVLGAGDYLVGARQISNIVKLPSDIIISGGAFPKAAPAGTDQKPAATFSQTYDDEGFAWWDVSIGIPVKGVKEAEFSSDGTVRAKTITRVNAYGLAHWYPYSVDLKGDYPWQPSVVAGLPLSGRPLDKPFVGLAIGTHKPLPLRVNVFAGAVFNKVFSPQTLSSGSTATPGQLNTDLHPHRVTKLLVGIDIPISQFISAISKSK